MVCDTLKYFTQANCANHAGRKSTGRPARRIRTDKRKVRRMQNFYMTLKRSSKAFHQLHTKSNAFCAVYYICVCYSRISISCKNARDCEAERDGGEEEKKRIIVTWSELKSKRLNKLHESTRVIDVNENVFIICIDRRPIDASTLTRQRWQQLPTLNCLIDVTIDLHFSTRSDNNWLFNSSRISRAW